MGVDTSAARDQKVRQAAVVIQRAETAGPMAAADVDVRSGAE
jgi:hypothetical protein